MDLLNVIDKYEKMNNKALANNIKILKQIFDSEYINYSSNPKSISFNSDKQLLSLRKSKIVINDKLTNSINKDIFRICTKDTNIFNTKNSVIRSNAAVNSLLFATLPSSLASFNFFAVAGSVFSPPSPSFANH